jgi:hypothetical protein
MATDFQPLHNEIHKDVKITAATDVADLKDQHALGIIVQEFARAGGDFPIVFIKDPKEDRFFPIVMLGLEQNTNLFVTEENKWDASYMPARYTHKPFTVIPNKEDENRFGIAIDAASKLIGDEGQALFDADGKETEYFEARKKALIGYIENEKMTTMFVDRLVELDLIQPKNLNVKVKDKEINLNGLFMVDEKKLHELKDEDFLDLRNRGFLAPIYSHLVSVNQVNRLLERKAKAMDSEK